jgi:hypothetical protein
MSYNGSGTYIAPAGNPVVSGTVIQSSWANTLVTDISNTFNNALPRDGQAPMSGQLKVTDGSLVAPSVSFNSESSTGLYRPGANLLGLSTNGVEGLRISSGRVIIGTTSDDTTNKLQLTGNSKITGNEVVTGSVTAGSFSGAGTGLTGTAASLTAGTASALTAANSYTVANLNVSGTGTPVVVNSTTSNALKISFQDNGTTRGYIGAAGSYSLYLTNASNSYAMGVDQSGNMSVLGSYSGAGTGLTGTAASLTAGTANALNSANSYTIKSLAVTGPGTPTVINSTDSNSLKIAFQDNGTIRGYIGANSSFCLYVANASSTASMIIDTSGNMTVLGSYSGAGTGLTGTAANLNAGIGAYQTWSAPSRAANTLYTNSTSKPITVCVTANATAQGGTVACYVNYAAVSSTRIYSFDTSVTFIVPPGLTYQINTSSANITYWSELS